MNELLQWLGARAAPVSGQGVETTIEQTWPWPMWVAVAIFVGGAAWAIVLYWRERTAAEAPPLDGPRRGALSLLAAGLFFPLCLLASAVTASAALAVGIGLGGAAAALLAVNLGPVGVTHRWLMPALRVLAIWLILFMMFGYVLRPYRTNLPDLIIALDDSASMEIIDRYPDAATQKQLAALAAAGNFDAPSRFNLARAILLENDRALIRELESRYRVRWRLLGESARAAEVNPADAAAALKAWKPLQQSSRLGDGVRQLVEGQRGRPTAAILLLTDGITSEGETLGDVGDYARRKQIPLFLVGLGNPQPALDLRLHGLLVDPVLFVDDVALVDVQLTHSGYAGRRVRVRLHEKGQSVELAGSDVVLGPPGKSQPVRLRYVPRAAREAVDLVVAVAPLDGEIREDNNREERRVAIRDETLRVLLVQAYPNYEFRYLKNLFERATKAGDRTKKAVALTTLLVDHPELAEFDLSATTRFPVRRDDLLDKFDVVIFGDVNPGYLTTTQLQSLADFVRERGGGLVVIAGPRFTPLAYRDTPLAHLLPIDVAAAELPPEDEPLTAAWQPMPTRLGLLAPNLQLAETPAENIAAWQRLPGLYWLLRAPSLKPGAQVLVEHPIQTGADGQKLPVIALQHVGNGKVVFHATDETWRWRFRRGDAEFARYWMQTVRYLSRAKLLGRDDTAEVATDRDEYQRGEPVRLRVRFLNESRAPAADDGVTVALEQEGGKRSRVQLRRQAANRGVFEATLPNLGEGRYRAWVAAPTFSAQPPATQFAVVAPPGERARVEMDEADLKLAAEKSRGRFYTLANVRSLAADLPPGREVPIEALPPEPLWNAWPIAVMFAALLIAEWLLRKDAGLM